MDYWQLREIVKKLVPRKGILKEIEKAGSYVKQKGRKVNYQQFDLKDGEYKSPQRLLNKDTIQSFVEISLRAAHCPMPVNLDTWDGILCNFGCLYCFADSFRSSLYTSFFDNWKEIGYRHCNPTYFKQEMDKHMVFRSNPSKAKTDIQKAFALEIPLRFGIRFEDFNPIESKKGVSLEMLRYLCDNEFPTMINTKSDLVGEDRYLEALSENKGRAAVHITMISSDEALLKQLEPGAPPFERRIWAAERLEKAGVRVVARIEPFMVFINDEKDKVDEYIARIKAAGISHITFDTYSYSAGGSGIQRNFDSIGWDFERMFTLMSDCQWLGSLLLGKFMEYMRGHGISCSTFDFGNVPSNDDMICCEVGDWFKGFSYGNTTMAIRFIKRRGMSLTTWTDYEQYVNQNGGFLSDSLRKAVQESWNLIGNPAYFPSWGAGIENIGIGEDLNRIWRYNRKVDFREEMLEALI